MRFGRATNSIRTWAVSPSPTAWVTLCLWANPVRGFAFPLVGQHLSIDTPMRSQSITNPDHDGQDLQCGANKVTGWPLRVSSLEEDVAVTRSRSNTKSKSCLRQQQTSKFSLSEELVGFAALAAVPILWGTYGPLVRFIFSQEIPMPGFVFSSCYFTVAAVSTIGLSILFPQPARQQEEDEKDCAAERVSFVGKIAEIYEDKTTLLGGAELGTYVLLANFFQVVGLETVPSDQAGFLFQMTTVFVPLVSALLAWDLKAVGGRTWLACLMAFGGIVLMNVDSSQDLAAVTAILSSFDGGAGLVLIAALLYTMNIVRIGEYADKVDPLRLTAVKTTFEAVANWAIVGGLLYLVGDSSSSLTEESTAPQNGFVDFAEPIGQGIADFFHTFGTRLSEGTLSAGLLAKMGGAIVWAGVMCTAMVVAAQSYGQRLVKASDANLIYSLQPIFTALFGSLLLGEQMDSRGFLGGGIILSAVLLVASQNMGEEGQASSSITDTTTTS